MLWGVNSQLRWIPKWMPAPPGNFLKEVAWTLRVRLTASASCLGLVVLLRGGRGGQYVSAVCFGECNPFHRDRFRGSHRPPYACCDPGKGLSADNRVVFRTGGMGPLGDVGTLRVGAATLAALGSDSGFDCWTAGCLRSQLALSHFRRIGVSHFARSGRCRCRGVLLFSLDAGAGRLSVSRHPDVRGVKAFLRRAGADLLRSAKRNCSAGFAFELCGPSSWHRNAGFGSRPAGPLLDTRTFRDSMKRCLPHRSVEL